MAPRRLRKTTTRAAQGPSRPVPVPVESYETTPISSAYPSTYPSEAENDAMDEVSLIPMKALTLADSTEALPDATPKPEMQPFRFMDLPAELRVEIYARFFDGCDPVIDFDPRNYKTVHKKLAILRTCRAIYEEASHVFYSMRTFRIFPTQSARFTKIKKPLLARLTPRQRRMLTSLELRLGPGWNKPPRSWVVNTALGLADCVNVHKLTVFVQFDPSDNFCQGFRKADGFYEAFSKKLLGDVLTQLPALHRVYFDAWSSVKKKGAMMSGLLEVTSAYGKPIGWGPERGWTDGDEEPELTDSDSAIAM